MAAKAVVQQPQNTNPWSSKLLGCCEDLNSCLYGLFCCPCMACSITGEFGEISYLPLIDICGPGLISGLGIPMCVPPVSLGIRQKMRQKYAIEGSLLNDIMVSCCCVWCSWCQMNREMKLRKASPQ